MMKVCLTADYTNKDTHLVLRSGTILYGQIRIQGERVNCNFVIAENADKRSIVDLYLYDTDNTPGIDREKLRGSGKLIVK